jgi:thiol:disulfide interchange protein DsbD
VEAGDANFGFFCFKRGAALLAFVLALVLPFGHVFQPKERVVWAAYSPAKLADAQAAGQPVVVDFYADWCIPCHELERMTYTDPEVIRTLAGFERLKVDVTRLSSPEAEAAISEFGVLGVPTVLFLDATGQEVEAARITGFVRPKEFLRILRSNGLWSAPEVSESAEPPAKP